MQSNIDNKYQKKILTIPNLLSLFRLCLIPLIVWLYCEKKDYNLATIILIASGITDVIDGFIARHFDMISDFGKIFDPVADKLTQIAVLFCLVSRFPLMKLPLIILFVKEIFMGITGLLAIKKTNIVLGAVWHGKIATFYLYTMMLIHLMWYNIPETMSQVLIWGCIFIMLLSAILYGIRNMKMIFVNDEKYE